MNARRPYRSDVSDARWALIEPVFTAWRARRIGPGPAARVHDLREIVNAILYVNRTGIPWEYLPHDFPPCKTVYGYYAKWEADGTTQQVHDLLRDKTRRAHGRSPQPTAAVVDAQSVKTSTNVAETSQGQGIDAGKRTAVIGSGAAAFTALATLADLAKDEIGTHAVWILCRRISGSTFDGGTADQLPARGALGLAAKAAVDDGHADAVTGFRTEAIERDEDGRPILTGEDGRRLDPVDEVIVLTGFRPDLSSSPRSASASTYASRPPPRRPR
ncbi:transposase [Streptomyces sp. NPDC053720]|uniref:transposase n=1 Tax=Streptomyces sp. NPDC053720 TaxID=3154855 RepID=UPI003429F33C